MSELHDSEKHGEFFRTKIGGEWHVLFKSPLQPNVFVSVARFGDEKRAESYCEVENDCYFDDPETHDNADLHIKAEIAPPSARSLPDIERKIIERMAAPAPMRAVLRVDGEERRAELKARMLAEILATGDEGHGGTGPLLTTIRVGYSDLCAMLREIVADGDVVKIGQGRGVRYYGAKHAPKVEPRPHNNFVISPPEPENEPEGPGCDVSAPDIIESVAIDALREAGASGLKPSRLRDEIGLPHPKFVDLMKRMVDAGRVALTPGTGGQPHTYRIVQ